ncbi:helix-turn-helix domain-containing protein [Terrimonas sp. NA20]|uniref:Helix-turn-helix domain-containing protein n=1 Tax=Terrimonas ginsenosidimutans TaxID=2908004 RepID=A0ABS9KUK5_9BACT|nr:helix-turn-helix domain-containing protein [Terrimonas ginsenosidimutans]MCG2615977.1 helix-turn-helix domain-containing protein [Terrimonas ginsenosidimutans]
MLLNHINPSPILAEYIRLYRIIDFFFEDHLSIPPKLYSPRPEHCLQFYPRDTESVMYPESNITVSNKRATLVGQHTILQHRCVGKNFLSFQVVFQPTALFRLTGIPLNELTNVYMDAADIFGNGIHEVNERLFEAASYKEMVSIVETFLIRLSLKKNGHKALEAIDHSINKMIAEEEHFGIDPFLKNSYLSHRQFDRLFKQRVGISPKQFLQVIRFDKAYRLKNKFPETDWLTVAVQCGYHDYQHLVKDYKTFTGHTPTRFFALDNNAPERLFGDAET